MQTHVALLAGSLVILTLAYSGAASATTWQNGQVITYVEGSWGTASSAAGVLLTMHFNTVYASTFDVVTVGLPNPCCSMSFDSAVAVFAYLPAGGSPGTLNGNLLDPTSTSSGTFGGDVLALRFDVDFSDAGFLLGTSNIPFGNLVLENFTTSPLVNLNGLTVRDFLATANTVLGGGFQTTFTPADLDPITADLTGSFSGGTVSTFAQDHLVAPTTCSVSG